MKDDSDLAAHLAAIDAANRRLRRVLRAHAPDSARPWQRQVALTTRAGWSEGEGPLWGTIARVSYWCPEVRETLVVERWAPDWKRAIARAVVALVRL